MFTPHVQVKPGLDYGFGWYIASMPHGKHELSHDGDIDGFSAAISVVPEDGLKVIVLSNFGSAPVINLARNITASLGQ